MDQRYTLAPEALGPTITIGEILVEIMATTVGNGFREAQPLIGPFPSGAPAIFIDQVAKLGGACGIVSAVGDDDFGHLNIDRLARDGVDVSAIAVLPDLPTEAPSSATGRTARAISFSTSASRLPARPP